MRVSLPAEAEAVRLLALVIKDAGVLRGLEEGWCNWATVMEGESSGWGCNIWGIKFIQTASLQGPEGSWSSDVDM